MVRRRRRRRHCDDCYSYYAQPRTATGSPRVRIIATTLTQLRRRCGWSNNRGPPFGCAARARSLSLVGPSAAGRARKWLFGVRPQQQQRRRRRRRRQLHRHRFVVIAIGSSQSSSQSSSSSSQSPSSAKSRTYAAPQAAGRAAAAPRGTVVRRDGHCIFFKWRRHHTHKQETMMIDCLFVSSSSSKKQSPMM